MSLLIEKGLLDVIFTNDGKEYLTPEQLTAEINDELYVSGGRINLTELAKILNVDLSRVTASATKVSHKNRKIFLILGQLIHDDYIQRVAAEINEKLIQLGEVSVTQLTEVYDLPPDFLQQKVIDKYLGTIIHGKRDPSDSKVLFTQSYIARCKAKVRGALVGITRPTAVANICALCKLKEKLFHSLFDELNSDLGTVTSRMTGAQYIPNVYKKMQNEFVSSRFRQNGYVQHDAVSQFGVGDPQAFIQRHLPNEELIHLVKCTVGKRLVEQLEAAFEECLATGSYLDVLTVMPSDLGEDDVEKLLGRILTPAHQRNTLVLGTTILTQVYVDTLLKPFEEVLQAKCKESVDTGKYQQFVMERQAAVASGGTRGHPDQEDGKSDRREERRKKAASGKAGGGAQGRETKTKSTKKHYRGGDKGGGGDSDSNDEQQVAKKGGKQAQTLELISAKDIVKVISKPLEAEGLEDLAKQVANHYFP